MKVTIVGGIVGGESCAAIHCRSDELSQFVLMQRAPHSPSADCGFSCHLSGVILFSQA